MGRQIADQATTRGVPEAEVVDKVLLEEMAVRRLVEPAEVAELAAFLCGPASASVTGTPLTGDGGVDGPVTAGPRHGPGPHPQPP